jgi:hypothetical protein
MGKDLTAKNAKIGSELYAHSRRGYFLERDNSMNLMIAATPVIIPGNVCHQLFAFPSLLMKVFSPQTARSRRERSVH